MANYARSALISFVLTIALFVVGQVFKGPLSESRQGTLVAGLMGSLVFLFTLTTTSNFKMTTGGTAAKSGLSEVGFALFVGIISSAMIHRVAITICVIFSGCLLYFANVVSHQRYNVPVATKAGAANKKK